MKNKKKICVVASIITTILLIYSCQSEKTKVVKKININSKKIEMAETLKQAEVIKPRIDNSLVREINNKVLLKKPKEIINKKVVSEKKITKENFYILPKKKVIKENIKEPIKIVTEKITLEPQQRSTFEKIKENIILLFGNLNFSNRDHMNEYKQKITPVPPVPPIPPVPPVPPIPPIPPVPPLPPIPPIPPVPPLPKNISIWKDGKGILGKIYTSIHNVITFKADGLRTNGSTIINNAIIITKKNFSGMHILNGGVGTNNGIINSSKIGMLAERKNSVGVNNGNINVVRDHSIGMATNAGTVINEGTISGSNGTTGIKVENEGLGANTGEIKNIAIGMEALNNSQITNDGDINLSFNNAVGMQVFNGSNATNNKNINVRGDHGIGMSANTGKIINKGTISGSNGTTGIKVENEGIGTNTGEIKNIAIGMEALNNSQIINDGDINLSFNNAVGMQSFNGSNATNNKNINVKGDHGIGMSANAGTVTNKGSISGNNGTTGIKVENEGLGANTGEIKNIAIGMEALNNSQITNDGDINLSFNNAVGMQVFNGSNATNNGNINVKGNHGIGMSANAGTVTNEGSISGSNGTIGMFANAGTVINKGHINGTTPIKVENEGIGTNTGDISGVMVMEALNNSQIINDGYINLSFNNNVGMQASNGSQAINNDDIYISYDMFSEHNQGTGMIVKDIDSQAINNGTITIDGDNRDLNHDYGKGIGIKIEKGAIGINKGTISSIDEGQIEMNAIDVGSQARNDGAMMFLNEGIGIKIEKGAIGINKGTISGNGIYDGVLGMSATGLGSTIINENEIISAATNYKADGMFVENGATGVNQGVIKPLQATTQAFNGVVVSGVGSSFRNEGKIINNSDHVSQTGTGISAREKATAINTGTIILNPSYDVDPDIFGEAYGVAMKASSESTVINKKTINVYTSGGIGIKAESGSTGINEGTINLNNKDNIGMEIVTNSTGINKGTINLNGNSGIGIKVDGVGSSYVNNGNINIASGTTGNQKIVLSGGATFSNSGSIVADGEFNTNQMGDGQFIISDGGTLEANKIKGNIYASGALAMGGYDDIYSTYKMLKTNNLEGDIISNSAMFDAHFTENKDENGFYDVVLDRKNFNDIVSNEKLGKILENNYKDNGNELKEDYYDALKLVSTEKGLDKAVEDSYGMSYYPTLAKQTFEIAKDSNQVIVDQVLNNTKIRKTGETIAIAGMNTTKLKNDSYNRISGYDTDLYSVYLGAEKQLNKDSRIGGVVTIGKANTDYKDVEGSMEDYYYQGNIYYTYENDERLKFTSMIYGGITDTSLERTLAFGSLNETMKDDINNYYIGLNNELSKKYYFNRNYLKPKFELDFTYMNQDDISESGDQGLKINGVKSMSIETGLGLALGRDFYMNNGSKINLEGSVTGYAELGNPYKNLNSTFETLSTDKVKIEGYNNDDFYGDIMLGGSYETKESLKFFTKLGYRSGNDSKGLIGNIGMNYLF